MTGSGIEPQPLAPGETTERRSRASADQSLLSDAAPIANDAGDIVGEFGVDIRFEDLVRAE